MTTKIIDLSRFDNADFNPSYMYALLTVVHCVNECFVETFFEKQKNVFMEDKQPITQLDLGTLHIECDTKFLLEFNKLPNFTWKNMDIEHVDKNGAVIIQVGQYIKLIILFNSDHTKEPIVLQHMLEIAVEEENYEEAARLRDKIITNY